MTPIVNVFAFAVHFEVVDALGFVPMRACYFGVELDVLVEVILLCETFEVLSKTSASKFNHVQCCISLHTALICGA